MGGVTALVHRRKNRLELQVKMYQMYYTDIVLRYLTWSYFP